MKQISKIMIMSAAALSFVLASTGSSTYAADAGQTNASSESIAISPTSKRYTVDPGIVQRDNVKVINDGTIAYNFTLYARPYSVNNSQYEPNFNRMTVNGDAYKWINFQKTTYRLEPGQTAEVPYSVVVPDNVDSGGHYGVILAQTQPANGDKDSVVRQKRVGVIVYATVKGNNKSAGDLLSSGGSYLQTSAPLQASSIVKNSGNVDFVDTTSITVKDIFGNQKYQQTRDLPVLPSTSRDINYSWVNGPSFGLYNVSLSHKFLGKVTSKSFYVLMIPIQVLALLVAVIIFVAILLIRNRKNSAKVRVKQSKKSKK